MVSYYCQVKSCSVSKVPETGHCRVFAKSLGNIAKSLGNTRRHSASLGNIVKSLGMTRQHCRVTRQHLAILPSHAKWLGRTWPHSVILGKDDLGKQPKKPRTQPWRPPLARSHFSAESQWLITRLSPSFKLALGHCLILGECLELLRFRHTPTIFTAVALMIIYCSVHVSADVDTTSPPPPNFIS